MDIVDSFPPVPQAQYVGSVSDMGSLSPTRHVLSELQGPNAILQHGFSLNALLPNHTLRPPPIINRQRPDSLDWLRFAVKKGKQDVRLLHLNRICKQKRELHGLHHVKFSTKHPEFNLAVASTIKEFNSISNRSQLDPENFEIRGLVSAKLNSGCKNQRRTPKRKTNNGNAGGQDNLEQEDEENRGESNNSNDPDEIAIHGDSILMDSYLEKFNEGDLVFVSEDNTAQFIGKIKEFSPLGVDNHFQIGYILITILVSCKDSNVVVEQGEMLVNATSVHGIGAAMSQLYGGLRKHVEELDDYCLVCNKKYREGVSWIQCKTCQRWQHERCREGKYTNKWYYCWKCMDD